MEYTIDNGTLRVTATTKGGELLSVQRLGKERLWQNPTGEWAGHAPLLFPVCGHFDCVVNGVEYPLPAHGFAKRLEWKFVEKGEDFLRFSLQSSEETKKQFPFDFIFYLTYRIDGETLFLDYTVKNEGAEAMFFACGGHETFAFEGDIGDFALRFEKDERFIHYYHDDGGYLTGETKNFGEGKYLPLPKDFLQNDATLILGNVQSRKVEFCKTSGETQAVIRFDGFSNLLLWRAQNAAYICIEPWTNLPDYVDGKGKEFSTKDGVVKVEAGKTVELTRSIEYK